MTDWGYIVQEVLVAVETVCALVLLVIGALSWRRSRDPRLLRITVAFGAFFIKGVAMTWGLYNGLLDMDTDLIVMFDIIIALDVVALLLLYLGVFR